MEEMEQIFTRNSARKPSALYTAVSSNPTDLKPEDVLDSVYSQIKKMQLADGRSSKMDKDLSGVKKSNFLTVNNLPNYYETPKQTFETQCISNTQLINMIEDAEAIIDHHKGITQEFETTFIHNLDKNSDTHGEIDVSKSSDTYDRDTRNAAMVTQIDTSEEKKDFNAITNILDKTTKISQSISKGDVKEADEFETTFTQTNVDKTVSFLLDMTKKNYIDSVTEVHTTMEIVSQVCDIVEESSDLKKGTIDTSKDDVSHHKTASKTEPLKMCKDNKNSVDNSDKRNTINAKDIIMKNVAMEIEHIKERSPSPVFSIKAKTKIKKNLPLIVSLESFEKFERLAIPLIESNDDFDYCKHLINSQLLGGELCLHTGDILFNNDGTSSPILEKSCDIFNNVEIKIAETSKDYVTNKEAIKVSKDKQSDCLEDEILFSSDEENDYIHREFQDLPLTAALETSFYDHSNVLEETMYVGFQTASNKSIQICTNSFQKAQNILDESDRNSKDFSVTEIVEICKTRRNSNDSKEIINSTETKLAMIDMPCEVAKDQHTGYKELIKKVENRSSEKEFGIAEDDKNKELLDQSLKLADDVVMKIDLDEKNSISKEVNIVIGDKDSNTNEIPENFDDIILQEFENIEMSLEETNTDRNNIHEFQGFKTANNKNIDISDAAKARIKDIFQDIDLEEINEKPYSVNDVNKLQPGRQETEIQFSCKEPAFTGFKTANNKNIKVSAQALAKTNEIFQDIEINKDSDFNQVSTSKATFIAGLKTANHKEIKATITNCTKLLNNIDPEKPYFVGETYNNHKSFQGFKTASNKNVKISTEALQESKRILQDLDINDELIKPGNCIDNISFKTASNKALVVSKQALDKSRKIFQDIDDGINTVKEDNLKGERARFNKALDEQIYFEKDKLDTFDGFKTASNKNVNISEEALAKSKTMLEETELDKYDLVNKTTFGFQTANKKHTEVSKEALERTKSILNDFEAYQKESTFIGFQTASKKKVEVSKEALKKSKDLFKDIEIFEQEPTLMGFQTANKKNDTISKVAIENTKNLFKDVALPKEKKSNLVGFQIASKKKVLVSKEAIEKTKLLFKDIEITEQQEPLFMGFQTANNKNVEVSKDALENTKGLFDDIEILVKYEQTTFGGFKTANRKPVSVSEQALYKSKDIFKDINTNKDLEINISLPIESEISFTTANNNKINVSEHSLKKSTGYLDISKDNSKEIQTDFSKKIKCNSNRNIKALTDVNIDNIINTQVLNHFEESLCTEDFNETPRNKRSSSPILSCPRAKKKKRFETPYNKLKTNICGKMIETQAPCKISPKTIMVKEKSKLFTENYKKNKIYTLKDLPKLDNKNNNIDPYIPSFNLDNILNFQFVGKRNELTGTKIKMEELKHMFLTAVNKNLVPDGWLDNHLKLILWKLLSYEVKLCCCVCTVQNVVDQLKYRYDKELYNTERPLLRKIFEKDDVSTKTMVLCVGGIYVDGVSVGSVATSENIELLLTDGWYFIKATIDKMLSTLVHRGRIVVGSKLVTSGAELVNCEQGIAPWEDTSAIRLKLFGNSTRPAPWHAKLGYSPAAILSRLSTVKLDGGKVARLKVYVARVYPLLYVEKFADGSTVTRSERLEHLHQMKYEGERELMMEKIYEEVQKEFSDQESQDSDGTQSKRKCLETGSQIAKMMKRSKDPTEFRAQLTSSQVHQLQEHASRHRDKMLEAIQNRVQERHIERNVVALVRCRIVDVSCGGVVKGMLSIWKPNDAVLELLKEGSSIEIMNVVPTAIRYSEIQITAGRQSIFRPVKMKTEHPNLLALKRTYYKISDVADNPTMATDYNEIDTVGIVFLIEPSNQEFESSRNFQNVYLADADKNVICVNFWGGVKKFGFQNILDTGQIVAGANLQKRAGNTRKNIPQFRVTEFSNFTKTPKYIQARDLVDDLNKKLLGLDRRKFCDDCVAIRNNYTAIRCLGNTENQSPYRYDHNDYSLTRNKMFIETPVGVKANMRTNTELNLTGLDFDSSFKQAQELSPRTLQRKRKVNERIAKLKMYGEPPPLSPINIINKSSNAKNSYKSPLTNTSVQNSVAITKSPEESRITVTNCEKSPILSLKRSHVISVPVKLNFENENNSVDHFAEEFDASPPLSLE